MKDGTPGGASGRGVSLDWIDPKHGNGSKTSSLGHDPGLKLNEVVDEVTPEALEEACGAVDDVPLSAVESEGGLSGGKPLGREARRSVQREGRGDALEGELALDPEVGKTGGGVSDGMGTGDPVGGLGVEGGVEEVIALEVADENVAEVAVLKVGALELSEVDDELASRDKVATDLEVAGADGGRAPVFVEEIAAEPFKSALVEIDLETTGRRRRWGWTVVAAFEKISGSDPTFDAVAEFTNIGVASPEKLVSGHSGFVAVWARSIDHDGGGFVRRVPGYSFEEGDLEDAVVEGSRQVPCGVVLLEAGVDPDACGGCRQFGRGDQRCFNHDSFYG